MSSDSHPDLAPGPRPSHLQARIAGPAELIQAIPYLLGFRPAHSLVLIGLADGVLVVTARLDLPDSPGEVDAAALVADDTVGALTRGGATSIIAVIHDEGSHEQWWGLVSSVDQAAAGRGCLLLDALHVGTHRWRSYLCGADESCCPPEGTLLPTATSSFAAAATLAGIAPLDDRAALESTVEPLPDSARRALNPIIADAENAAVRAAVEGGARRHRRSAVRALFAAARRSHRPEWSVPDDASLARYAVALRKISVRDSLWMGVDDGRIDGRVLWRTLARHVPSPYDAAPLFLYGWVCWRAGDGARASIAAQRALAGDPAYTAADLLLAALNRGVDPRSLPRLRLPRSA